MPHLHPEIQTFLSLDLFGLQVLQLHCQAIQDIEGDSTDRDGAACSTQLLPLLLACELQVTSIQPLYNTTDALQGILEHKLVCMPKDLYCVELLPSGEHCLPLV